MLRQNLEMEVVRQRESDEALKSLQSENEELREGLAEVEAEMQAKVWLCLEQTC